ncbi:MAG: hypothetical protein ACRCUT_06980 [Spirochaetota bacterium]
MASFRKVKTYIQGVSGRDAAGTPPVLHMISEYDERGNMTASVTYEDGKTPEETVRCAYNSENLLIEETIIHHRENRTQKRIITIDNEKRCVTEKTIYSDGGESRSELYRDERGNPLTSIHYYDADTVESREEFSYDAGGRLSRHAVFDSDNDIIVEDTADYSDTARTLTHHEGDSETQEISHLDGKGNVIRIERIEGDDLTAEETAEYNEQGRLVKAVNIEMGQKIRERNFTYDNRGNRTGEELQDFRYRRSEKVTREYDGQDRVISETRLSSMGESFRLTFEYE